MDWQKYVPWLIGGAVLIYIVTKMRSRTTLAPQTQITQTPQIDPYLDARTTAFSSLMELFSVQAAQDTIKSLGLAREETERLQSKVSLAVANRSFDTEVTIANIYAEAARLASNLNFLQRKQDTDFQQRAIDRYYSSRTTSDVVGSISSALGQIFGNRGGGTIFGTPPINPNARIF